MPIFPSEIKLQSAAIASSHATQVEFSRNGQRTAVKRTGHLFKVDVTTTLLTPVAQGILSAFFDEMEGRYTPFDLNITQTNIHPLLGNGGGTPLVNGAFAAGLKQVESDGWPSSLLVLRRGDFIQFASHKKTYRVVSDVTSTAGGAATIVFSPQLMVAVANNSAITISPLLMRVVFQEDTLEIERTTTPFSEVDFSMVEAWNV